MRLLAGGRLGGEAGKAKSVVFTERGQQESARLLEKLFGA